MVHAWRRCAVTAPDALRSFYGRADATGATAREQVVLTPLSVLERLPWWSEGVALDPCWAPGALTAAETRYYVPPRVREAKRRRKNKETGKYELVTVEETYFAAGPGDLDGLALPWLDRTFCNPVYAELEAWLESAVREHLREPENRITLLVPVRTHRRWFRAALEHARDVDMLDPVTFVGHTQSFPAPLWLIHYGR